MKKLILLLFILSSLLLTSCTENSRARSFGGTEEVSLKPNEKFLNITWKQDNLWVITQDTITGICYAREKSSFGVWEGTIIIK